MDSQSYTHAQSHARKHRHKHAPATRPYIQLHTVTRTPSMTQTQTEARTWDASTTSTATTASRRPTTCRADKRACACGHGGREKCSETEGRQPLPQEGCLQGGLHLTPPPPPPFHTLYPYTHFFNAQPPPQNLSPPPPDTHTHTQTHTHTPAQCARGSPARVSSCVLGRAQLRGAGLHSRP